MVIKIISAVAVFGLLILFHELGHFTVAKLAGVRVYEFSIGFGPKLFGFRRKDTNYNLRVVPLGGFVRMAGMDPEEDKREAEKENKDFESADHVIEPNQSFMYKSIPQRMAIIAAGPVMNFLLAIILFAASFIVFGLPENKNVVGGVVEGKPAAEAGLKAGDVITRINNVSVRTWEDLVENIHENPGKEIEIEIKRGEEVKRLYLIPEKDPKTQWGMIGIIYPVRKPGIFESVKLGTEKTYEMLRLTFYFLGKMLQKEVPVELSGPVRITYELGKAAESGIVTLMNFAALLSIQIGLFNLFPIPALDGSRLVFLMIEGVRGAPVDPSRENFIHLVGLALLLLLMVVVTYKDIVQMLS